MKRLFFLPIGILILVSFIGFVLSSGGAINVNLGGSPVHLSLNTTGEREAVFNGVNQYLLTSDNSSLQFGNFTDFSVSLWVKIPVGSNGGRILGKRSSGGPGWYFISSPSATTINFQDALGTKSLPSSINVTGGNWHNVLVVANRTGNYTSYIDGVVANSSTLSLGNVSTTGITPFIMGAGEYAISNYFNGSLDEVMIWNRSLSSTEVSNIYSLNRSEYNGSRDSLIAEYNFDNGYNNFVDSVSGMNGTGYGGVYTLNSNGNGNVPYDSLIGYWNFDRDNGTAFNVVNNGVKGTYQNGAYFSPGLYSNSLQLDGFDDYIILENNSNLNFTNLQPWTFSAWVKSSNYSIFGGKFRSYGPYFTYTYNYIEFRDANLTTNQWLGSFPFNQWHHLIFVADGIGNMTVYANGVSLGTKNIPTNLSLNSIGAAYALNGWGVNGSLDEVMIFGTALNSSQVLDIYNNQSNRFVPVEIKNVSSVLINSSQNYCNFTFGNYSRGFNSNLSVRVGEWDVSKGYNESDNGLVGYWHMDDLNVDSLSLNGENQVINGSPLSGLSGNQSRTYSFWMKNNINNIGAPFYQKGLFVASAGGCGAGRVNLNHDGRLSFDLGNNSECQSVYSTSKIGNNSGWFNVVFIYDGSKSYFYLNGNLESSANITLIPSLFASQWMIGTYAASTYYNGSIDEFMVFNRNLSQAEITNIYNLNRRSYNGSTSGLLNYWAFNDSNNFLKDYVSSNDGAGSYSINGNTSAVSSVVENIGTVHGNLNLSLGQFGNAINFDGVDDYLDVGNISSGFNSDNLTISFWAKPNSLVSNVPIFSLTNENFTGSANYYASLVGGNALGFSYKNSTVQIFKMTSYNVFDSSRWNHFLFTRSISGNNVNVSFYVNYTLVGSFLDTNGFASGYGTKATIGGFLYGNLSNSIYYNGSIDELMIFNRSLSSGEIKALYDVGRANYTYTDWQEVSSNLTINNPTSKLVALSENTTRIIPQWRLDSGSSNFYSPFIFGPFDVRVIDTVKPLVQFESPTPVEGNGVIGSFIVNASFLEKNFNYLIYSWNGTNTTYTLSSNLIRYLGNGNYIFTKNETAPTISSIYNLSIYIYDQDLNFNSTGVRRISGNSAPIFNSFSYNPSSRFDLDPNENIYFSANISDSESNLDSVYAYYKKDNGSWSNGVLLSAALGFYNYTFNFTEEGTYTINFTSNDSFGFSSFRNVSLPIYFDCDWNSTVTFDAVAGYDENKFIGNISVWNLGDSEYANNNCSLNFRALYDTTEGTIFYNGQSVKGLDVNSNNPVLAGQAINVTINVSFGTAVEQRDVKITLDEYNLRSDTHFRNTSVILVTNKDGPYLFQEITSYPISVYLTPQNVSLFAYLRNLMGSVLNEMNNTAYNVSVSWSLPSGLSNISGNLSNSYGNISDLEKRSQDINFSFNNLASFTSGVKNFSLSSFGVDYNGSSIKNAFNQTTIISSVEISFLCYSVPDGVYVSDCGSQDGDYVVPSSSTGSGGGGGGGVSMQGKFEKSEANFELIIGKSQQFILPIYNNFSSSKKNLQVSVSGLNSEYLSYSKEILEIVPYSYYNLSINISSPVYFTKGKYVLKFVFIGTIGNTSSIPFREEKYVNLYMLGVSRIEAVSYLNSSEDFIFRMNDSLFNINEVSRYYSLMQKAYAQIDFDSVKENFDKIKQLYEVSFSDYNDLVELKKQIILAEKKGISVIETKKLVSLAEALFKRGDYLLARQNLDQAKLTYALQVKGEFNLFYSVLENPLLYFSVFLSFFLFIFGTLLFVRYRIYKNKINSCIGEEKILLDLMKVIQRKAFSENKMSMEEYQEAMRQYESKLRHVVEERIKTETLLVNMLRLGGKRKALNDEKAKIIQLIKNTQNKYLNQGALETRIYENMLRTYSRRLGQIEEELVYLEAREHFGNIKNLFFRRKQ